MVDLEKLRKTFTYSGGSLYHAVGGSGKRKGVRAGTTDKDGYRVIRFNGKRYKEHRLIWFYHYGEWPKQYLDHINMITDDNRIENLREATREQNAYNQKPIGGSSNHKGVSLHKCGKWQASCTIGGKQKYLGLYLTETEAATAYKNYVKPYHGEYYRDT